MYRVPRKAHRIAARWRYSAAGAVAGSGAPLGALLIRAVVFQSSAAAELASFAFFYLYMLIGTSCAFAIGGYLAGRRADRLERERNRFHDLSEHDALTGMLNARAFTDRYERETARTSKSGEALALLLIDVDHLKRINDEEGHEEGSRSLGRIARAIDRARRTSDVAARWGGDEFALLMPGANSDAAHRVATAILDGVNREKTRAGKHLGVSIGIATTELARGADLFSRADAALYLAKNGGRGRIAID